MKAAEQAVREGMKVNMTLVFSQEQAAAVYAATRSTSSGQARPGEVFVSPFVGRLDDRGENGMDLVKNIIQMYNGNLSLDPSPRQGREGRGGDGHVEVLTASVRSVEHMKKAIDLGSDILTAPLKVLKEWNDLSFDLSPGDGERNNLQGIPFKEVSLDRPWQSYNIAHELTDKGIEKFSADWNNLVV